MVYIAWITNWGSFLFIFLFFSLQSNSTFIHFGGIRMEVVEMVNDCVWFSMNLECDSFFFLLLLTEKFSFREMFLGEKIEWQMWKDDFFFWENFFLFLTECFQKTDLDFFFFEYFYMFTKSDHKSFDEWFRFKFLWSIQLSKWLTLVQTHRNFLINFFYT